MFSSSSSPFRVERDTRFGTSFHLLGVANGYHHASWRIITHRPFLLHPTATTTRKEIKQPYFLPPSLVPLGGGSSYTHTQSLVVDFLSYLDRKELPPFVCVRENVHSTPIIKDFNPEGQLYRNMCVQQQFRVCVI